jgi:DNA polymerase-3 subunit epsilon
MSTAQVEAARWAYDLIHSRFTILDTETTGLDPSVDQAVEIAVIDQDGNTLFNRRVKPTCAIGEKAIAIHRIDAQALTNAPGFGAVADDFTRAIAGRTLVIYNASYDTWVIRNTFRGAGLAAPRLDPMCAMLQYARFHGDWNGYHQSYRWQRLTDAIAQCDLPIKDAHSALGDCRMTLAVIRHMAVWYDQHVKNAGQARGE